MANRRKLQRGAEISFSFAATASLKGKQSVRATFKLPAATIEAVTIIATHLGIKQKSLFDHLMDDMNTLETIASQINPKDPPKQNRVQKTYVISRRSLHCLEEVAKEYRTPRDVLIEYSVQKLLPLIQQEQIKHRNRKKILIKYAQNLKSSNKLLEKAKEMLGEDDQVYEDLAAAATVGLHTFRKIENYIAKGEIIEQFDTRR